MGQENVPHVMALTNVALVMVRGMSILLAEYGSLSDARSAMAQEFAEHAIYPEEVVDSEEVHLV